MPTTNQVILNQIAETGEKAVSYAVKQTTKHTPRSTTTVRSLKEEASKVIDTYESKIGKTEHSKKKGIVARLKSLFGIGERSKKTAMSSATANEVRTGTKDVYEELILKKNEIEQQIKDLPNSIKTAKEEIRALKEKQKFSTRMRDDIAGHYEHGAVTQEYSRRFNEHNKEVAVQVNKWQGEIDDLQRRINDLEDFVNNRAQTKLFELKRELDVIDLKMFKLKRQG